MKHVRTRFAPSPTGFLHIGGLRSALFCYAWAKRHGGDFLLRIEDTDQARLVEGAVDQIIRSLRWAGVLPNEGVVAADVNGIHQEGDKGPYIQSERLDLYKKFAQELLEGGKAYKCWCTSERLDAMRAAQRAAKQMPKYDRHCYHLSEDEKRANEASGIPAVVRFFVPDGTNEVAWDDIVFGRMVFDGDQVDDFVMMKADGFPTYNFANVIDDHTMEISHVIRGQEFLSSTPKHILLYEAYGWEIPVIVHVSWILGKNKQKLSKRHDSVSVDEYRQMGILPEALNNYLALLGWNPKEDQEIFHMDEFIRKFDLKDVQKSGAVFDLEKLLWMNGLYIREMDEETYTSHALGVLEKEGFLTIHGDNITVNSSGKSMDKKSIQSIVLVEKPRLKRFEDLAEKVAFFFNDDLQYDKGDLVWKKGNIEDVPKILTEVIQRLELSGKWGRDEVQSLLKSYVDETGWGTGDVFWPVRVAVSGQKQSPGPDEIAAALGKEETLRRLQLAVNKFA